MTSHPALIGRQAVLEGLPDHPAITAVLAWNDQALTDAKFEYDELTLTFRPKRFAPPAKFCASRRLQLF